MERTRATFRQALIGQCVLSLVIAVGFAGTSLAAQFDAPYYELQKKHGAEWAKEDKAIDAKLVELEKKFGKKRNIDFILADDISYTELGSYGGGKVRGFSTPNLDLMVDEGMRFLSFTMVGFRRPRFDRFAT